MEAINNLSPLETYQEYLQQKYPGIRVSNDLDLWTELEKTNWDEPESALDLNNIAVLSLIEAEKTDDLSIRSLYVETAIEALTQGIEIENHPLCVAHLALVYTLLGELQQADKLAFYTFVNTLQPAYQDNKLSKGLIYLFPRPKSLTQIHFEWMEVFLKAEDGYAQALLLFTEVLSTIHSLIYHVKDSRFLEFASQIAFDLPFIDLRLGISGLFKHQPEGLFYLQRARKNLPNNPLIIQSLYLAYRDLQQYKIAQFWHQVGEEYHQKMPQSSDWLWTQFPLDSPVTYVPFDEDILLAVEASFQSIVTSVLLSQGEWFELEMEFWRNQLQPGMTVIDVGANVGVYTFSAARKVGKTGKVIAIEPFTGCVNCLKSTCQVNSLSQVQIYLGAASDRNGKAFLSLHAASEINEVVPSELVTSPSPNLVEINCLTLDSLIESENLNRVDWIKLDAEGHEMQVLAGSEQILRDFSPNIIYENIAGDKASNTPVAEFLLSRGYFLFRYQPYLQQLIPVESLEDLQGNLNIIAISANSLED